jgi:hypothetical protein
MTGCQVKGRSFRGALRYNLEKVEKGVAEILDHSFTNASEKSIMKEVQMVRMQKPNLQKYFYHTSINFPPNENLSNDQMKKIALDYLDANGFSQHQYIMFRHHDADHPHLHILVNRIGYNGEVISDSNDYARSEKVLRTLEKKYDLTQVISSREAKERAMNKNELEMMKRKNAPSHKMSMQSIINDVLKSKNQITTNEFISNLHARGVDVLFNQASTGYVSGISYSYQGMIMKGAKLGNDFKWSTIKNIINYEQERDRQRIYEANVRSKSSINKLRAGNEHAQGNRASTQQGEVRYGKLPDTTPKAWLCLFRQSFTARLIKEATQSLERATQGVVNTTLKIPKVLPLATLLNSHCRGNNFGTANESLGDAPMKKKPKKKRKRGLGL